MGFAASSDVLALLTAQLIVAIVGNVISTQNLAGQRVLIAFVCIFIAFFAATWGPLAWVVTSEIYPQTIRGKVSSTSPNCEHSHPISDILLHSQCMSMSTASNWLFNFAIGYATPYLVNSGKFPSGSGKLST